MRNEYFSFFVLNLVAIDKGGWRDQMERIANTSPELSKRSILQGVAGFGDELPKRNRTPLYRTVTCLPQLR
jgi:hypothetical protein